MSGYKLITFCILCSCLISRFVTRLSILHLYTQIIVVARNLAKHLITTTTKTKLKIAALHLRKPFSKQVFLARTHLIYWTKIAVVLSFSLPDSGMIVVRLEFRPRVLVWISCCNLNLNPLNSGITSGVLSNTSKCSADTAQLGNALH